MSACLYAKKPSEGLGRLQVTHHAKWVVLNSRRLVEHLRASSIAAWGHAACSIRHLS